MTREDEARPTGPRWLLPKEVMAICRRVRRHLQLVRPHLPQSLATGVGDQTVSDSTQSGVNVIDPRLSIMAISDDPKASASLAKTLEDDGYSVHVVSAVPEALAVLREEPIALIVVSGQVVAGPCLPLRQATSVPILALLPVMAEEDILDAFLAGADDCQSAIIGDREVLLRVPAMLRRTRVGGGRG